MRCEFNEKNARMKWRAQSPCYASALCPSHFSTPRTAHGETLPPPTDSSYRTLYPHPEIGPSIICTFVTSPEKIGPFPQARSLVPMHASETKSLPVATAASLGATWAHPAISRGFPQTQNHKTHSPTGCCTSQSTSPVMQEHDQRSKDKKQRFHQHTTQVQKGGARGSEPERPRGSTGCRMEGEQVQART